MCKTAFVTGGTGFIGTNLIQHLRNEGWKVTVFHRPGSKLTYLRPFQTDLKQGSVTDIDSIQKAMPERCDAVFHLAGDTNLWSRYNRRQREVNVDGTRNMLHVAASKEAGSFIYASSASAWGDALTTHITESVPKQGGRSWVNYERTKWSAEQEVQKYRDHDMNVVILNPTTVTGPYDRNNWGKMFLALQNGKLPGIPDGVISVTHVDEVARAFLSAVSAGRNGENYILSGETCTLKEFITRIAKFVDGKEIPNEIPTILLKTIARFQSGIGYLTGESPDLTPELIHILTRKGISYSSEKAKRDLGYRILPLERSIEDCYNWLSNENFLN
ncbi:MAG: NAD-dependent epimerase/dehydratase family protein [Balneolaceae bacterium]